MHKNLQKCRWQINLGFGGSFACYRRFKTRSYPVSTYRICTTARFQRPGCSDLLAGTDRLFLLHFIPFSRQYPCKSAIDGTCQSLTINVNLRPVLKTHLRTILFLQVGFRSSSNGREWANTRPLRGNMPSSVVRLCFSSRPDPLVRS